MFIGKLAGSSLLLSQSLMLSKGFKLSKAAECENTPSSAAEKGA